MNQLEIDLRFLGVWEKALEIAAELGPYTAIRYIRSSCRTLAKVYHPDLNDQAYKQVATQGQKRLNLIKERLDLTQDQDLARFLGAQNHTARASRHRILVVEDESGLRENLADLLGLEGFHVSTAANGVQGLGSQLTFRPDLVITDVVMPIMDGVEMVRQMRQRDLNLKAIFISGFFGTRAVAGELVQEIQRFGYPRLSKPFRPSQLFDMVHKTLT
ncbi:response regulator [Dethiosulfatarculus sandiegensis]|uniref:Chemotaxis protein CheY n=1 Tax=Dethiosulfatarculus sandiegensis TaxID=1429043 RepID=A0A0D2GN07_9BACT|nr:response regulator [Dethiosulfatarculus sandiegensis]KIX15997.1 chemotaxis protein CheY [Dethiosulfatarculus sandiegensis]